MTDREKLRAELRQILDKPIFPREGIDPIEAVTDYLLDNDVLPVVRCKDCKHFMQYTDHSGDCGVWRDETQVNDFCSYGEREEARGNG